MAKTKQTPGAALNALLKKHGLNYNRLAKAIGLSSAMVRLIARDENPVSASVAFRLAKFFKTKPEYWLALQMDFDNAKAAGDKKLAKALKDIPTVDKATFERKPRTTKAKSAKKAKPKGKPAKKSVRGRKAAAKPKKAAPKKAAKGVKKTSVKRAKPATSAKKSSPKKTVKAAKAPAVKKAPAKKAAPAPKPSVPVKKAPVVTVKPEPKPVEVQSVPQQPSVPPETPINEPQI
ncbi:MAG: HigA family addiction module antidote protein [Treponema sp.]|jgi:addiction module HigA family antidote|nr:HigA family addiction module antidote protein [Treponema sp.]